MATPLSADAFVKALKAEGVKVQEYKSWRTHNRDAATGKSFGPVYGVLVHHTATGPKVDSVPLCYGGRSDLPGPLCHGVIRRDGTVVLVGHGRANHAGGGDPTSLQHAINEDYDGSKELKPKKGNSNGVDGNDSFYGFECENAGDGKDPWPAAQVEAMVRVAAAICRTHKWGYRSVLGHKEWSSDKIDPRGVTMPSIRSKVKERLSHAASWSPSKAAPAKTTPVTPAKETASMPLPGGPYYMSLADSIGQDATNQGWLDVVWGTETTDEAGVHATNDAHFGAEGYYHGVIYLQFSDMTPGTEAQARLAEVDSNFDVVKTYPIVEGVGTSGSTFFALPVAGKLGAGRKLKVQVIQYDTDDSASLVKAYAQLIWTTL